MSFLDYTGLQRLVEKINGLLSALETRVTTLETGGGGVTETLLWEGDLNTGSLGLPFGDVITNYDYLVFVLHFTGGYEGLATYTIRAADCTGEQKLYIGHNTKYVYGSFSANGKSFYITNAANARTRKLYGIKL